MTLSNQLAVAKQIPLEERIYTIRGRQVMLENDAATLFNVHCFEVRDAVSRIPDDFLENGMFQMTQEELMKWSPQVVASRSAINEILLTPYCFTEANMLLLAILLDSYTARQFRYFIIRHKQEMLRLAHNDLSELFLIAERVAMHEEVTKEEIEKAKPIPNFPWPKPGAVKVHAAAN
jgi:hypothetical protein